MRFSLTCMWRNVDRSQADKCDFFISLFRNHLVKTLLECGYTFQEIMSSPTSVSTQLIAANYASNICIFYDINYLYFTSIQCRLESLIQDYATFWSLHFQEKRYQQLTACLAALLKEAIMSTFISVSYCCWFTKSKGIFLDSRAPVLYNCWQNLRQPTETPAVPCQDEAIEAKKANSTVNYSTPKEIWSVKLLVLFAESDWLKSAFLGARRRLLTTCPGWFSWKAGGDDSTVLHCNQARRGGQRLPLSL